MTAGWEQLAEWKKINDEGEEGVVSLETIIRGVCEKARLLDLVEKGRSGAYLLNEQRTLSIS
jgi:type I restriction enzyme R subunit